MGAGGRQENTDIKLYAGHEMARQDHQYKLMAAARKANAALFTDYRELMDTVLSAMPKGDLSEEHFDMVLQLFGMLPVVSLEAILDELSIPLVAWNRWRHKHPEYTTNYKDIAVNKSNRNVDAATRLTNLLDGFPSNELIKLVDIKTKLLMKQAEWLDPAKRTGGTAVQVNTTTNVNTQPTIEVKDMTNGQTYILE